jgi:hypothetical protein
MPRPYSYDLRTRYSRRLRRQLDAIVCAPSAPTFSCDTSFPTLPVDTSLPARANASISRRASRALRLAAPGTPPFHGGNTGSILAGANASR